MKKIFLMLSVLGLLMVQACEGPAGPPGLDGIDGLDGEDGEDGVNILSAVLETQVTFNAENDYGVGLQIEIPEAGNYLVYMLWGLDQQNRPIWRLMPQTVILEQGLLIYNYQYSNQVLVVFMEIFFDPAEIPAEWINEQVIRIVYLPGFFAGEQQRVDYSDYNALMNYLGKEEKDVEKLDLTRK